jgi:fumarate reductase subunit D
MKMMKIEKLREIISTVEKARAWEDEALVVDILTEETIDEIFTVLPSLLKLYDATHNTYHGIHDMRECGICTALMEFEK